MKQKKKIEMYLSKVYKQDVKIKMHKDHTILVKKSNGDLVHIRFYGTKERKDFIKSFI